MAKPNPEQRRQTRARIVDAFWGLYEGRALSEIKVRAVTDAAGVNRTTFYEYFDGLPDLLEQAEGEVIDEISAYLVSIAPELGSPGVVARAAGMYERYGSKLSALLGPHGDPAFGIKLRAAMKPLIMEDLELDGEDPASDLVAECSLGALTTAVAYWYDQGKPVPAERLAHMLQVVVTQGILNAVR